jgi:protein SCO1/2
MIKYSLFVLILATVFIACGENNRKLPYLGNRDFDGKDTVYHAIPDFSFINQDGDTLSQNDFKNKVYVSDFFFTSCPTICPTMKTQMLRIYEKYKENPEFGILSHTIDPNHDTVEVLKKYRDRLGVKGNTWQFVTGDQKAIYKIAQDSYMVSAMEDSSAVDEGGFVHSGAFVLVDKDKHVRGVYDGTKEIEVSKLLKDIDLLLKK